MVFVVMIWLVFLALVVCAMIFFQWKKRRANKSGCYFQLSRGRLAHIKSVLVMSGDTLSVTLDPGSGLPDVLWSKVRVRLPRIVAPYYSLMDTSLSSQSRVEQEKEVRAALDGLTNLLKGSNRVLFTQVRKDSVFGLTAEVLADGINVSDTLLRHGLVKEAGKKDSSSEAAGR